MSRTKARFSCFFTPKLSVLKIHTILYQKPPTSNPHVHTPSQLWTARFFLGRIRNTISRICHVSEWGAAFSQQYPWIILFPCFHNMFVPLSRLIPLAALIALFCCCSFPHKTHIRSHVGLLYCFCFLLCLFLNLFGFS